MIIGWTDLVSKHTEDFDFVQLNHNISGNIVYYIAKLIELYFLYLSTE